MVMDKSSRGLNGSTKGLKAGDQTFLESCNQNLISRFEMDNTLVDRNHTCIPPLPPDPTPSNLESTSSVNSGGDLHEECDFSDVALRYINQMLMEEDMEEKACMFQEALQATEKSLYEVLGEKYPPTPDHGLAPYVDQKHETPDESLDLNRNGFEFSTSSTRGKNVADTQRSSYLGEPKSSHIVLEPTSESSCSSSHSTNVVDGFADSPVSTLIVPDIFCETDSAMQFKRGFEEASKFLPNGNGPMVGLKSNGLFFKSKEDAKDVVAKAEEKHKSQHLDGMRGKKNPHPVDVNFDGGRSNKQSSVYSESTVTPEMFDMVLLNGGKGESMLCQALQNGASMNVRQNGRSKGSNGGRARGKRQGGKRDVVDLRTLLTLCAQAVATNDQRSTNELLKQIRQHSSPTGDGMQRVAHYFANGLEARIAGSGTQIYTALITRPTSAADVLKAYHLFLGACPFRRLSNFFSDKTIMNLAEKATRLHIVDFGILYGFQWPGLIQRLSSRPGGPPKLRITGIDLPQPGFRPAERVEETGCRLAKYADTFNVRFEFNAIAQKWDTIQIEDLKLGNDEVLVVNCMYRLRNLLDETVVVESPRHIVLNLIRKMNPDVFLQGIENGAFSAPFFITRFREALFHYSTLFDMLETTVRREIEERLLIEREIFGREAMNVIACEGSERIERPETYKQWQVRNLRCGFRPLPLNREIVNIAKDRVKKSYHKDFLIDEDGEWLLQGWKGRITYALSSWRPVG
ncbi:scarecrow-like protein 14 [Juglans microcarpa x Juglans regia]|uniref:scarecrow-like protein 14 n=1 Tax=Juglans microcarpa x Juglans regia TaxID=2249226 RepID=UPI001B7E9341|nr:scarecrow-like protein 14 [Juglans microcarpa x Juglans regia]